MKKLRGEMKTEVDQLNGLLNDKMKEIESMKQVVIESEGVVEEREQLLAEIM